MRLQDNTDFTTLTWVKPELDETLRQARNALQNYVEEGESPAELRTCSELLHQVQGTLRMVELYGAAMVAEEMEQLARALVDGKVGDRDSAYGALMQGIVQLPDYLERLQSGHRDIPIVLLPLLNSLRESRGEQGLSESVLFSPDLSRELPPSAHGPQTPLEPKELSRRAEALRGLYQGALLRWLKDDNSPATIRDLTDVCEQLVPITWAEPARRLFWVAAGTLDALARNAFPISNPLKQSLAKVEREIKRLADGGDAAFRTDPPIELTKQLLYFVAHEGTDVGRIGEIRAVFGLTGNGPSEAELAHARGSLSGNNRALLETVAVAIKEDLLRVKDALDLHLRTPGASLDDLGVQADALDRVADTLGMLGLGVPRRVVQDQRSAINDVISGQRKDNEDTLLDIAGALLYVEAALDDQVERLGKEEVQQAGTPTALPPSNESRRLLEVLIKEAIVNFAQARQSFVAFVETHWDHAQLTEVPRLLTEVAGALRILDIGEPAGYLAGIRQYTENELLQRRQVPNGQQMDRLADALASIEYYLEALRDRRPNREQILEVARESLTSLGYWPLHAERAPEPVPAAPRAPAPIAEAPSPAVPPAPPVVAQTPTPVAPPVLESPPVPVAFEPPAPAPVTVFAPAPAAPAAAAAMAAASPAGAPIVPGYDGSSGEEIDDEIREVFLEEFEEEIENLAQLLPAWRQEPGSAELLRPIRRVFHTLKGSGRLVGAKTLGEFSWKIESLLNRVLDGSRPPSPQVFAMVQLSLDTLPLLRAALAGEEVHADLEGMQATAEQLAAGEEVTYSSGVVQLVPESEEAEAVPVDETDLAYDPGLEIPVAVFEAEADAEAAVELGGPVFSIDPVLLEILKPEVAGHLEVVDAWLAECASRGPQPITDPLVRSIHTMNGAFAMTELVVMTDVTAPLEGFVKRSLAHQLTPGVDGVALVADAASAIRETILAIGKPRPVLPHFDALSQRATALRDSLPDAGRPHMPVHVDEETGAMPQVVIMEAADISAIPDFDREAVTMQSAATNFDQESTEPVREEIALEEIAFEDSSFEAVTAEPTSVLEPPVEVAVEEIPAVDQPAFEELVFEEVAIGETVFEEAAVEQSAFEELAVEEAAFEQAAFEQAELEEVSLERPFPEEAVVDEPVILESASQASTIDELETEEPVAQTPAFAEDFLVDEIVVEEVVPEQIAAHDFVELEESIDGREAVPAADSIAFEEAPAEEPVIEAGFTDAGQPSDTEQQIVETALPADDDVGDLGLADELPREEEIGSLEVPGPADVEQAVVHPEAEPVQEAEPEESAEAAVEFAEFPESELLSLEDFIRGTAQPAAGFSMDEAAPAASFEIDESPATAEAASVEESVGDDLAIAMDPGFEAPVAEVFASEEPEQAIEIVPEPVLADVAEDSDAALAKMIHDFDSDDQAPQAAAPFEQAAPSEAGELDPPADTGIFSAEELAGADQLLDRGEPTLEIEPPAETISPPADDYYGLTLDELEAMTAPVDATPAQPVVDEGVAEAVEAVAGDEADAPAIYESPEQQAEIAAGDAPLADFPEAEHTVEADGFVDLPSIGDLPAWTPELESATEEPVEAELVAESFVGAPEPVETHDEEIVEQAEVEPPRVEPEPEPEIVVESAEALPEQAEPAPVNEAEMLFDDDDDDDEEDAAEVDVAEVSAVQAVIPAPAPEPVASARPRVPMAIDPADPESSLDLTDLDTELLDLFLEESNDLLDHSDGMLAKLRERPDDRDSIINIQRDLHTLKGGARMAGIYAVGELGHAMESLLESVAEGRQRLDATGVVVLERGFDRLHGMVARIGERKAIALPAGLIAQVEALSQGKSLDTVADEAVEDLPAAAPQPARASTPASAPGMVPLSAPAEEPAGEDEMTGVRAPQEQVRIRADLLDRLVNYAGEVAIYRARLEQQLGAFRANLGELDQTTTRLREQLRRLDIETEAQIVARYQREGESDDERFDPLELDRFTNQQQLTRALNESANDLVNLQGVLDELTRQYETLLLQQSRVSSDLQEGLMRTRMVPFDALVPRLRRVLRQAATDTGKQVQLKVDGASGEMDRNVLDRMTAPLEHMLRNAMAHGLELPEERRKARKPEEGMVRIAVQREGSEVVLKVTDDGRGLNKEAIRAKAVERGLIKPDAEMSDEALYGMILESGFSTAETVSRLSGRGVGMDVVYSEIRQLGGTLQIRSEQGKGSEFIIRLPFTLAVTQAVFVKIGDTSFAVPIASVRGVGRIARADLDKQLASENPVFNYAGEDYAIHDLGHLIGHAPAKAQESLQMPLLLARSGDLRTAISIDQVLGSREIVVKPVGPQVNSVPGIFGATIMGDGRVVVILDVAPLVRRHMAVVRDSTPVVLAPVVAARRVPVVMVVDDSITMRKVTGRVLERNNMEVLTAKDGVDAVEKMAERVPDLVLLDIEMPRMDGYEVAQNMRSDPRLKDVPIIMITSRTGDKHRQRAMDIGVNRYLGKPYQEPELMRNVFEMLGIEAVNG